MLESGTVISGCKPKIEFKGGINLLWRGADGAATFAFRFFRFGANVTTNTPVKETKRCCHYITNV